MRYIFSFLVKHETFIHSAYEHKFDLTMHNVGKDSSGQFHAEDNEEQEGKLDVKKVNSIIL